MAHCPLVPCLTDSCQHYFIRKAAMAWPRPQQKGTGGRCLLNYWPRKRGQVGVVSSPGGCSRGFVLRKCCLGSPSSWDPGLELIITMTFPCSARVNLSQVLPSLWASVSRSTRWASVLDDLKRPFLIKHNLPKNPHSLGLFNSPTEVSRPNSVVYTIGPLKR